MPAERVIRLHAQAPAKPALAAPCNGCGACCASEPCPISRVFLGHRSGSCPALVWEASAQRYHCGMVTQPTAFLSWLPKRLNHLASRACRRWIAAGIGCDFAAELEEAPSHSD